MPPSCATGNPGKLGVYFFISSVIRYEEINFTSLYLIGGDKLTFSHRNKNFLSHPIASFLLEDIFEILTF